jgi:hypothetical protein
MCIEAVKLNGYALRFVHHQTEAICMEAVKKAYDALRYVRNQTEAICIESVKQCGYELVHVHNQTEAICIEAVKNCGSALVYVKNQTEAICTEAVRQYGSALVNVRNKTDAICLEALDAYNERRTWWYTFEEVYNTIEYPSPQLINQLVKIYPSHIDTIMSTYATDIMKTYKVCSDAICAYLVRHADDLLYRPNNVNALVSHSMWHRTINNAKTVFLWREKVDKYTV